MKKKKISASAKRTMLIVLSVVLALILVALIVGTAYMESLLNLINKNPDDSTMSSEEYQDFINNQAQDFTGEADNPNDVEWDPHNMTVKDEEHIINIMLIGQDRRPGEGRTRSDVMILCTVNKATQELTLTSFMRDMYVQIPGYQDNKMNATYVFGGMDLLDKCMEINFGVHIDGNMEVDFDGFIDIIDLMGGVDIYLSNSEANHLIKEGYSVSAGNNRLNGEAALAYTRNRSTGNADFDRTGRQRKVMNALFEKCRGMNLSQLKNLMEKALPMITTDLTNRELLDYMMDVLPMLTNMKVNSQRIPADDTFTYASYTHAGSVLVPDLTANRKLLLSAMAKTK